MIVIAIVLALKFILPVLYLRIPFAAGWANFFLDSIDGDILIPAGLTDEQYQPIDKLADYVTYVFIMIWGWRRPIRKEIAITFALRTVGQALYFATRDEIVFFYFPNFLEPLFLIYVTLARFRGEDGAFEIYTRRFRAIWLIIIAYKLQDEWVTHVGNIDRTSLVRGLLSR